MLKQIGTMSLGLFLGLQALASPKDPVVSDGSGSVTSGARASDTIPDNAGAGEIVAQVRGNSGVSVASPAKGSVSSNGAKAMGSASSAVTGPGGTVSTISNIPTD